MIRLLLKAALKGGSAADLFATQVDVRGHLTEDGTYIAPHRAIRHKRLLVPAKPAPAAKPKVEPSTGPAPAGSLFDYQPAPKAAAPAPEQTRQADPEEPKAASPLLLASRDEWETAIYAAVQARFDAGSDVAFSTTTHRTVFSPKTRDALRLQNGKLQVFGAGKWFDLGPMGQPIDSLAGSLGLPTSYDRMSARAESPEIQAADAARLEAAAVELRPLLAAREKTRAASMADVSDHALEAADKSAYATLQAAAKRLGVSSYALKEIEDQEDDAPEESISAVPAGAWGVPAGTSEAARRKLNAAAVALLEEKQDEEMTPADRDVLAQYSGNGGCGASLNEFYTEPDVADAMWSMLRNAGFAGGAVLEPSCGTGVFLRTAPADAHVTGVELDKVSARIATILHPAHDVRLASLERFATQDGTLFDAVIGNAPFGGRGETAKADPAKLKKLKTHEQYFVDTGLDKLRDGGLMAIIVNTAIMNNSNQRGFRESLLRKAEFLGAHRLPNTAFEAANTDVTTDILLFRKRPAAVAGALATLTQAQFRATGAWDADFLSGYFEKSGRANVHGTAGKAMRSFGEIDTVDGSMDGVASHLAQWAPEPPQPQPDMMRVLAELGDDEAAKKRALDASAKRPYQVAKLGDVAVIDGVRCILQGDPPRWHAIESGTPEAVKAAMVISEGLDDLLEGRAKDPRLTRAMVAEGLDEFIAQHGLPAKNKDLLAWIEAPALDSEEGAHPNDHEHRVQQARRRVSALLGAVKKDGTYSDAISGRAAEKGQAGLDSAAELLSVELGGFTAAQLAGRTGQTEAAVLDHMHASSNYAIEADGRTWATMDAYLSGELWPKLDAAKAAAEHEGLAPEYKAKYLAQAKILEDTIAPASLEDVEIVLSSGFITPATINAYFAAKSEEQRATYTGNPLYRPLPLTVSYDEGVYKVSQGHQTGLLDKYLNRTGVRKDDRDELNALNENFAEWVRTGPMREDVEERYNRLYKGFRQREYSDAKMQIPGLTTAFPLNAYHYSGLRWALDQGKGIVADDVGLGKTGRGLMLAKLAKLHGTAKKPTFVVPKSVLANWVEETQTWFPGSRVLVIGESYEQLADGSFKRDKSGKLVGKADTEAQRREKFHAMRQNEYDFILVSKPSWDKLKLSPRVLKDYQDDEFWEKRKAGLPGGGSKGAAKKQQKAIDAHKLEMGRREFSDTEDTIYFDDLGVDLVLMDEGHAYKNLFVAKNRFGMSPKFLGGSGKSNTAMDTYFKSKFIRSGNAGKGVFLLTATPTKNSPLEVYSMLSHIAPEAFEHMGIKNSEDFIDRFVEFTTDNVIGVSGELEEKLITSGFKNLGELREVMRRYINRRTADDVGLVIPEPDNIEHLLDMTPEQEAVYVGLRAEAKAAAGGKKEDSTGESHIFSIMSRMQKASTDLGLLGHKGSVSPKIDDMADTAVKHADEGGQIIFSEPVDSHETIAAALVKRGVPREQIAIINAEEAPDGADRQRICDAFNSGRVKYVIGNKTMEQGVNLQKLTSDIHHLDLPWEPATLQQRNGRGRRQGNKRASIRIHTYLAKKSFDVYRHQTIAAKRNWMDLLWNGGDRVENLGKASFSLSDVSIMLSDDPEAALAKLQADTAAAVERKQASDRARAVQSWKRLRAMTGNLAKLTEEKRGDSAAANRLRTQADRARELLHRNPAFPHKDLIDGHEEAIVEPVTGIAWRKGMGMEVSAGPESALKVEGDRPERFVVDIVDQPGNRVWLRSVGGRRQYPVSLTSAQLQNGVTPWTHTDAAEAEEAAHFLDTKSDDLVTLALDHHDISKVHKLPPSVAAKHADQLQAQIKHRVANHKISVGYGKVPMVERGTGKVVMAESWEHAKQHETHDYMLPTPEHRAAAIGAWADERLARTVETKYQEHGRSKSRWGGGGGSTAIGVKARYPSASVADNASNPYSPALKMHGKEAEAEATARVETQVSANITAAPTMHAAFEAAQHAIRIASLGHGGGWPKATVRALWDKAAATGSLGKRLGDEATVVEPARNSWSQAQVKAAGHKHFYQDTTANWLDGYRKKDVHGEHEIATVGTFLWHVAQGELKAELEAKLKAGA